MFWASRGGQPGFVHRRSENSSLFLRNILDLDNYSPISVANEEQYEKMVGQFPFHDAELEKVRHEGRRC